MELRTAILEAKMVLKTAKMEFKRVNLMANQ